MVNMKENQMDITVLDEAVINNIYLIRGQKIMLDSDLAKLYQVETKVLKQAVKRNLGRFPVDFMFEMTASEFQLLRSQFVTSKMEQRGGTRYLPYCFTEPGVAMLSSILNSERAILVNIQIIRTFIRLRQALTDNTDLRLDIEKIKSKLDNQDKNIELVFQYLDELIEHKSHSKERKRIGYKPDDLL